MKKIDFRSAFETAFAPRGYRAAIQEYRKKNWDLAQEILERVIKRSPDHALSIFKLGMCHFRKSNFDMAYGYMQKAVELNPVRREWKIQLNQSQRHIGMLPAVQQKNSEQLLREKIEVDFSNAQLHFQLADILRKQRKWWQVIDEIKIGLQYASGTADIHYRLGESLEFMRRYKEAAVAYQSAIEMVGKDCNAEWLYRLGYSYEREGVDGAPDKERAILSYKRAIDADRKLNSKTLGIGVFHQNRGHWAPAARAYAESLEKGSCSAELYYRLGLANDRCYLWGSAESAYKSAISMDSGNAAWIFRLGYSLERQRKYLEAATEYQNAISLSLAKNEYWCYRLCYVLTKAEKFEDASAAFALFFDEGIGYENLIVSASAVQGDLGVSSFRYSERMIESLISQLNEYISKDTTKADIWFRLGMAYEYSGILDSAINAYKMAISRRSQHSAKLYIRLGVVLHKAHRFEEASSVFLNIRKYRSAHGVSEDYLKNDNVAARNSAYAEYQEVLPIQKETVLYESFHGASIACNPLAIFLHLLHDASFAQYVHVWVVNDIDVVPELLKIYSNVLFIERGSDAYLRYLASSEYLVNNVSFPEYFIRREGQVYINTWHGTPIKYLGKDIKDSFLAHKNVARNFLQANYIVSPNAYTTNILMERYDVDGVTDAHIVESGYPRIDFTIGCSEDRKKQIRKLLGVEANGKVVLYAPTWRGEHGKAVFDTQRLIGDLEQMVATGGQILFRGHHMIEKLIGNLDLKAIVVPSSIDTNELLSIVDVLITDYSSIAFDFLVLRRPIIYYAYDLEKYEEERGLYFPLSEMPGVVCTTIDSVAREICRAESNLDIERYESAIKKYCLHDDGRASKKLVDMIFRGVKPHGIASCNSVKKVLFYIGPFMPNGILTSFMNLVEHIDRKKITVCVAIDPEAVSSDSTRLSAIAKLPDGVRLLGNVGTAILTPEEKWVSEKFESQNSLHSEEMWLVYMHAMEREFYRLFGRNWYDSIVHFEGYHRKWMATFGGASRDYVGRQVVYQHNDKYGEWSERFPYLEGNFYLYKYFDTLLSVSEGTRDLNRNNLAKLFRLDNSKFDFCENVQNPEHVMKMASAPLENADDIRFFDRGGPIFITMGRLSVEKDQEKLIRSFLKVVDACPKAVLIILGDGPLKQYLGGLVNQLGMQKSIYLLGRRDNPFPYLRKAGCFVLSSNHEGQPMVLFEAMILGKPIVATNIVGNRSVIKDGRPGLLVENSEEGLLRGMLKFVEGDWVEEEFDCSAYQINALEDFYEKAVGGIDG